MWFTFVTARLFHSLSLQPRLAATLLSSCSVANSPTRRVGLAPTLRPASLAQALLAPVQTEMLNELLRRKSVERILRESEKGRMESEHGGSLKRTLRARDLTAFGIAAII